MLLLAASTARCRVGTVARQDCRQADRQAGRRAGRQFLVGERSLARVVGRGMDAQQQLGRKKRHAMGFLLAL